MFEPINATTTPSVIPLTQGLGRSEYKADSKRPTKKKLQKPFVVGKNF